VVQRDREKTDGNKERSIGTEEMLVQEATTKPKKWIVYKRKGKRSEIAEREH